MLSIIYYGNPILRKKSEPISEVTGDIKQLIKDMVEAMDKNNGQGLAAPQIGKSLRLVVVRFYEKKDEGEFELSETPTVFINPEILSYSKETITMEEGCVSIPGLHAQVERPVTVKIRYMNEQGEIIETEFRELDARVFFHENDHLNGVLYIDRVNKKIRKQIEPSLEQIKRKYNAL